MEMEGSTTYRPLMELLVCEMMRKLEGRTSLGTGGAVSVLVGGRPIGGVEMDAYRTSTEGGE